MLLSALEPVTGKRVYLFDKNLPFGASSSCALFQEFSNSVEHIFSYLTRNLANSCTVNYLDDFLFISPNKETCNRMVSIFAEMCSYLGIPVARDKTVWAT